MSKKEEPGDDFAILGPETAGGVHVARHYPDHSWRTGVFRPLTEGEPVYGEVVCLEPRDDGTYSVQPAESGSGPAMVNNKAFRDGWDGIFGKKAPVGEA